MTLTLASSMLFSICIAKGLAMSKLGGVITLVYYAFNAWFARPFVYKFTDEIGL